MREATSLLCYLALTHSGDRVDSPVSAALARERGRRVPYKEGALTQQIQPLISARKNAISGVTAVLGVTLFVQEVQRIRDLPFSLVNYEYLVLLAVTGALVFLWIWGSEELEMLSRWLDPDEFPVPSSFNQLAMIMGLAFVLVCLFLAARDIRWYTSLFLLYMIVDFLLLRYVHGVIRRAIDGSYRRLREDRSSTAELYAKAIEQIEHYYFVRPHDLRRFVVFFAMGIACWLAFRGSNDDIYVKLAYGLSIVTVAASEIVIGYWRQARDNGLRAVEATLSEARRQTDTPSPHGGGRKRRQNPRGRRPAT